VDQQAVMSQTIFTFFIVALALIVVGEHPIALQTATHLGHAHGSVGSIDFKPKKIEIYLN
jgi:hypothetical protein